MLNIELNSQELIKTLYFLYIVLIFLTVQIKHLHINNIVIQSIFNAIFKIIS